jgi:hypothetical protein
MSWLIDADLAPQLASARNALGSLSGRTLG